MLNHFLLPLQKRTGILFVLLFISFSIFLDKEKSNTFINASLAFCSIAVGIHVAILSIITSLLTSRNFIEDTIKKNKDGYFYEKYLNNVKKDFFVSIYSAIIIIILFTINSIELFDFAKHNNIILICKTKIILAISCYISYVTVSSIIDSADSSFVAIEFYYNLIKND